MPPDRATEPFPAAASKLVRDDPRSLRALAEPIGISAAYLHRLLKGERPPSIDRIEQVAAVLGVPASYFIEVRIARIAAYLFGHEDPRERLWNDLPLDRG